MGCYIQSCLAWCSLQELHLSLYPFDYDTGDSCVTSSVLINSEENCICTWFAIVTYSRCIGSRSDRWITGFLFPANREIFTGWNPSTSLWREGKSCPAWIICYIKEPRRRVESVFWRAQKHDHLVWLNCMFHRQGKSGATRYKQQGMFFNDTETTTATAFLKVKSGTRTIYSWGLVYVKKRRYSKAFDFRKRAEIRHMATG